MRVTVCLKTVPGPDGVRDGDGNGTLNEWDAYALEEAFLLAGNGGEVVALSVGGAEAESPLRKALALGAARACRIASDGADPYAVARGIAAFCRAEPPEVILFGAQSSDRGGGQVGGMVAAYLCLPFVSLVVKVAVEGETLVVEREAENRRYERYSVARPCALSIQTGINTPRYVSVRGIHRAGRLAIEEIASPSVVDSGIRLVRRVPPEKGAARMLEGSVEAIAVELARVIRSRRGGGG